MAKFKPVSKGKKKKDTGIKGAIPCLVLIIGVMVLLYLLFVAVLRQT